MTEFATTVKTGPELYKLGLHWLHTAQLIEAVEVDADNHGSDADYQAARLVNRTSVTAAAAIAQAAFAGAQAAALGALAADEADSDELARAWREAIGDAQPQTEAETTDGE